MEKEYWTQAFMEDHTSDYQSSSVQIYIKEIFWEIKTYLEIG